MAPTKLQDRETSSNSAVIVELDEGVVIDRVGSAIAGATVRRESMEDPRHAARRAAVEIASAMLDASSADTAAHSDDVDVITEGIAHKLGLSGQRLDDALLAARLHDIGKLGVPLSIISKPGPLDGGEWELMHRHTIIGEQILLAVPELRGVAHLVRHSHERWDGGGYPDGLAGEEIPLGSRIVFCADAFHAIRSDRPYRKGRSPAEALAEIRSCAGTQFDPAAVEALEAVAADMRAARNGSRPRATRPRRLMALMLIISVGACGSAFARSGVMPEPKAPASGGTGSSGQAAAGLVAEPAVPGLDVLNASRVDSGSAMVPAMELMSAVPPVLTIPVESALAPGLAEAPVEGGDGTTDAEGPADTPEVSDSPGVRDHGQGIGRGKGKGKGRGAELGGGHQKPKAQKPKGSSSGASGHFSAGKAKGSSNGKAKGNSPGRSDSATVKGHGQAGAPKAPKAPKPPKATTPSQPPPSAGTPAAPDSAAAAPGPANSGNGNGNGHGHG